jgi:beta-galactosidase GanA
VALAGQVKGEASVSPRLGELKGRKVLYVDDRPFLILGLQWDCDSCFAPEIMDPLFPEAAKLGCNTAVLPLYWREIEPQEGRLDFNMLDRRLEMARDSGLRVILNWFGAYKNGCLNYAPDFVKSDAKRFRRVHTAGGAPLRNFACPTCTATLAADRKAVEAVCARLKAVDTQRHTVLLLQMENEAGILGTDRCHCPTCTRQFEEGGWREREKERAGEAFSAYSIATYLDQMAAAAKAVYALPVCVNAWLRGEGGQPGKNYPSGGPVDRVLDIYARTAAHIDFIAPDIYAQTLD